MTFKLFFGWMKNDGDQLLGHTEGMRRQTLSGRGVESLERRLDV